MQTKTFQKWIILLVVLVVLLPFGGALSQSQPTEVDNKIFIPLVANSHPPVALTDMWAGNAGGYERSTFRPGDEIRYITVGENPAAVSKSVELQWDQVGPCGATQIFSRTLTVELDIWVDLEIGTVPNCLGTYTNTVQLADDQFTSTLVTTFEVVNFSSEIVISDKQGFDKCGLPSEGDMQTWWDHSPYSVFNIYLGGSSFACENPDLDTDWVWDVSQQGWDFILTWVGPQSPCFDTIRPKIFYDVNLANQQGKDQADLAVAAAENLGFSGDKIIYYDLEGYTESSACRNAVDSFITGWTARLHEKGFKAGAYGSPCRSFIGDWWGNDPQLDDVWIAYWLLPAEYREFVEVFGDKCTVTDEMWDGTRRIRQYAGDHNEIWNGVSLGSIDSNVLLGEITAITTTTSSATNAQISDWERHLDALVRDAELITPDSGWVLRGSDLLLTHNRGLSWDVITPEGVDHILGIAFVDPQQGWLVSPHDSGELSVYQTGDSGQSWQASTLPTSAIDVSAVHLDFIDGQTGWVSFKMVSGSSFSVGQLFATQDGGQTWEERTIPLGEPVQFTDSLNGWVAGGPADDQYYFSKDGGFTWSEAAPQSQHLVTETIVAANLPENLVQVNTVDADHAWALTQNNSCWGDKSSVGVDAPSDAEPFRCSVNTRLWTTSDGGQSWLEITP